MGHPDPSRAVEAVRRFNRFYARHTGALHERLHKSSLSLTEVRILHELGQHRASTAADLSRNLGLDTGYLSRLINNFQKLGLVERRRNESDGRAHLLSITPEAKEKVDEIDLHVSAEAAALLKNLSVPEIEQLCTAMADVERLLSPPGAGPEPRLRAPRGGDFGWIIERYALLSSGDRPRLTSEAIATSRVSRFLAAMQSNTPRIACWVAEQDVHTRVGAALLSSDSESEARIELLFVEPGARRNGLGERLVSACVNFAHGARYEQVSCRLDEPQEDLCGLFMHAGFKPVQDDARGVLWQKELQRMYVD
ncbi:bifunctional helix-turn-helix transcriptional regulator/GNAT family N-acetyltransferase [Caballeronia insecticola]|uniref:Transcriptional regulator MarR family with acetyltransferase activity n=1 Tax=Caballeronia insecticola TaxID=758793 RepID=R4WF18_9BURK|nr:bifunctional helix-turn-helix transcriptional regulator/GNAT family N-acetyltransferase [Caballeronia insecticola]BAN21974.1 transcriptional regulator MarR family with acetyltransferase activity [Caballeronia insecticola]